MTNPGLDNRLRQHGRRAGLMVGLSMALTIGLCIGSFVWIYAKGDPLTRDFVDAATVAPTRKAGASTGKTTPTVAVDSSTGGEATEPIVQAQPTETPRPSPTAEVFQATHRVSAEVPINLRPGPAVASGDPVTNLDPGAPLQYLGESEPSQDPDAEGNVNWMKFRTQDGAEGWVREIDVEAVNAGQ